MTIQEESSDRWEHLEHVAYAIDGEPGSEADMLSKALESFPECTPDADYPGYAVRHLLESLLLNRGHKLRAHCPTLDPSTWAIDPNSGW